ncbi:MAG: cytochrome c family protein, partial [Sedimenticola sp.]
LVSLFLYGSGLHIGIVGQYESLHWVYDTHIVSSYAIVLILCIHLILFAKRNSSTINEHSFLVSNNLFWKIVCAISISSAIVIALTFTYSMQSNILQQEASITPYEYSFGDNPFYPSQAKTSSGGFVNAMQIGGSDKCGECHEAITKEWRSSMHGRSATDKAFQTNLHALAKKKGIATTRYCLGCHGPVALLSGQATTGGKLDEGIHISEGVSCMSCHGISKVINLKGAGSYLFEPVDDYLFGKNNSRIPTEVHNYLININPRQHKKDMARDVLYQPQNCATCHAQYIDKEINDWGWVKLQDQYSSWLKGSYSGHSEHEFSREQVMRCQDCHFPLVDMNDPSADKAGKVRSHRTPGANTVIPWLLGDTEQLEAVQSFMKADRLKIKIQVDNKSATTLFRRDIKQSKIPVITPDVPVFKIGEKVTAKVAVTNLFIGHNFPAGTIDLNEPWIEFIVKDSNRNMIYESGTLDKDYNVDPSAHTYLSIPVDRTGNAVWRHDLFNVVGSSYENLIPPGKSDINSYSFTIPKSAKGLLTITAKLRYRKFNMKYAKWALGEDIIDLPIVNMAKDQMTIQIIDNKPLPILKLSTK